ncbi:MAG: carboxy terminal-processing peptidase [Bacteroidetes bacterium]|nr:carboxy terminal-processing peptidase [Bacteroidota bacterium]MCB0843214.1 carboxy terminal-processing peptidase [Bacteroidota bacterium]
MKNKLLISGSIIAALFLFSSYTYYSDDEDKSEVLIKLMMQGMEYYHYQPPAINDGFSEEVFDLYLKKLDYNKRFLTKRDVDNLYKSRHHLDDELKVGSFEFFDLAFNIYNSRIKEAESYYREILNRPFDFSEKEYLETDFEKMDYPRDEAEIKERWRKALKYQTLSRLVNMIEKQDKAMQEGGDENMEVKSFAVLEEEARAKVLKSQENLFKRIEKISKTDRRAEYINAIANVYDPHTGYFPPKDKENFDISMSGRLEGIGAQLSEADGNIKVVRVVPGSASYRQGQLKVNDVILKVAQADAEPVDVSDMALDEAVKLIRGKKGTEVRLTVKKIDGSEIIIPITRDIVELEEVYAKSALIETGNTKKPIGYIDLPKFYADFQGTGGRRCADDVAKEIEKLTKNNVSGIILDLRDNGGGSLQDVVDMAGLFIEQGPIVQVKSRGAKPRVLSDFDPTIQYDGPLVIMVNSFSASASEIMAAAIQDYDRGIIVGTSTFGKGTVQRFVDLDQFITGGSNIKPLGEMKLTTQKFYRINGGATQLKGVVPDIILPDEYSLLDLGEKEEEHSMKWDEISPVTYSTWEAPVSGKISKLRADSEKRVTENETFKLIQENGERFKRSRDKNSFALNIDEFKAERKRIEEEADKYKEIEKTIEDLRISSLPQDLSYIQQDSVRQKRADNWHKSLNKDPYLYEVMNIMNDMK